MFTNYALVSYCRVELSARKNDGVGGWRTGAAQATVVSADQFCKYPAWIGRWMLGNLRERRRTGRPEVMGQEKAHCLR